MSIPFIDLKAQYHALKTSIDARIHRVLDHGQYIMGPEIRELETQLAQYVGVQHAISCASGTRSGRTRTCGPGRSVTLSWENPGPPGTGFSHKNQHPVHLVLPFFQSKIYSPNNHFVSPRL